MAATVLGGETETQAETQPESSSKATRTGALTAAPLMCWVGLIAATGFWGREASRRRGAPRYWRRAARGRLGWRVSADALFPIVFATSVIIAGPLVVPHLSWKPLVAVSSVLAALWAVALSRIDGASSLIAPFHSASYFQTARGIHDPLHFLSHFVQRIHSYNSHTRGHPPGMEILLWATARLGLAGVDWSATLAVAGGAAAGAAALVALREVTDESLARVALPFVVLAPVAIWWSSGDALFAGVSAWAVTLVVLATGREGRSSDRLAIFGGLLFGITAFLSYGLVLLAVIPFAVGLSRRRFRPLVLAACGAVPVFVAFGAAGFSWLGGLSATRTQYWLGAAQSRPYNYFLFADLAAFALAVGPAAAVAIARLRDRRVWMLVGGALAVVAFADLSGMSKAEVERIWLPFVPWVLIATSAFVASRRRHSVRFWLGVQAATAVLIEVAVRSPW